MPRVQSKSLNTNTKKVKKSFAIKKSVIITLLAAVIMAPALFFGTYWVVKVNKSVDQANIVPIRSLVIIAAEGTKKPAPVDPATGNIYFSAARLYLPANNLLTALTYNYDSDDTAGPVLSISSQSVFNRMSVPLYGAENMQQLFDRIPKLQACQRGLTLAYSEHDSVDDSQNDLKHIVALNGGKTLYVYQEKQCPELNEVADLLKNIQAY